MKYILLLLVSLALWGCSSNDELPEMADTGEQDMYRQVQEFLANESYSEAVRGLQLQVDGPQRPRSQALLVEAAGQPGL